MWRRRSDWPALPGSLELLQSLLFILLWPSLTSVLREWRQGSLEAGALGCGGRWVWVESSCSPPGCGSWDKWLTFSEPLSLICEMGILFFVSGTTGAPVLNKLNSDP